MMKKSLIIVLSLVLVVSLFLTDYYLLNNKSSRNELIKIGVLLYSASDPLLEDLIDRYESISRNYERESPLSIDINRIGSMMNQSHQNRQVDQFISLGYNVLVVNLVDRTSASHIIDSAMDAGIPVLFFNREPVQGDLRKWDRLFYIGTDARIAAEMQAQIILNQYRLNPESIDLNRDGIIQYMMLEGERRHQDTTIRTEITVQKLRDAGLILEKIGGGIANWDVEQARVITENVLADRSDQLELIISNNDNMALGALRAVEEAGLDFRNIVGIDGSQNGRLAVDQHKMLGTVCIDMQNHAKALFDLTLALAQNRDAYNDTEWSIGLDRSIRIDLEIYQSAQDYQ